MDQIKVPAGTIIKISGFPFELASATVLLGSADDYKLALSQAETSCDSPAHAAESPVTSMTSS